MPSDSIRIVTGRDGKKYTYYPTLILGAGESGIALGCRLKQKLGTDQFRIFDRQAGVGGTWWINRYPGVACDVPSVLYSFSFAQNAEWSGLFPPGPEFCTYLINVCAQFKILDKIQLNTEIDEARWLEDEEVWEVTTHSMRPGAGDLSKQDRQKLIQEIGKDKVYLQTEVVRAKVLASAAGGLVNPKSWTEDLPGKEDFKGDIFHSARWNYDVDLTDKDVIVVGSGCSAAQFVGRLAKDPYNAKSVTQVMRTPPWVVPSVSPVDGHPELEKYMPSILRYVPGVRSGLRYFVWWAQELMFYRHFGSTEYNAKWRLQTQSLLTQYMKSVVPEKYHEMLIPDYSFGCKRLVRDFDWFSGLNDPKVELTTLPLTSIQSRGVTLGHQRTSPNTEDVKGSVSTEQRQLPADVIVLANGFDVGEWLHPLRVRGKDGKYLNEVWRERGGAQAYLGSVMDGFPNFFLIFGPNTATGHTSVIFASENMVEFSLKFIEPVLNGDASQVEIKKEAEMRWAQDVQSALNKTVWATGGCSSWYKSKDGWNSTVYPYSQFRFTYECLFPRWKDWNISYTTSGLLKRRAGQALKLIAFTAALVAVQKARRAGYDLYDLRGLATYFTQRSLDGVSWGVDSLRNSALLSR